MKKTLLSITLCFIVSFLSYGQKTIKVLAIGNSFSEDAVENYLWDLGNADGVNLVIGNAYVGGCSLDKHWEFVTENSTRYSFRKIENGQKTTYADKTLEFCITNDDWDYITFQQVSTHSGIYDSYFPALQNLLDYVKTKSTNPNVKYAMHQTWAYAKSPLHASFINYDNDQMKMYNAIVDAVWRASTPVGIDIVIPSGTAIQNGRSSTLGDIFNRDASHLNLNIGRYTAACTWYETLSGNSVVGNGYWPVSISNFQKTIGQNAAHLAVTTPKSISDMLSFGEEDENPVHYDVAIRIIDKTKGERTSNATITDEKNVVIGLSQNLKFQGKGSGNWYYPLFNDAGTTGTLIKNDTAWIWQATLKAPVGNHSWYPTMKSMSYQNMNKRTIYYGENNNLVFTVADNGAVSGTTEILIDSKPTDVTLKVIDKNKGRATNGKGEFDGKNVYLEGGKPSVPDARVQTSLDKEFIIPATGVNAYDMFPDQGQVIEKNDTAWIWSATVKVKTGNYTWRPSLSTTNSAVKGADYMQFDVDITGNITGKTDFLIESDGVENVYQHFLIYGQSLSVGAQSYPVLSTDNVEGNYMLGDHIWINYWNNSKSTLNPLVGKLAKQNASGATDLYPFTRAGSITAECPLYGAVNHLQQKIGGNFIATSCGTGGRSIEELSKESTTNNHYAADFKMTLTSGFNVAKGMDYAINCPVIFFMQGENNYEQKGNGLVSGTKSTADKNEYKQLLITLKDNMQAEVVSTYGQAKKPVFITYQAGCQYGKIKDLPIGMAQLEASNEYEDIICAGPVYPMPDRGGHLDPNGYRWFGEMLAKVYYKTQILGENFKPVQPLKITRLPETNQIKIQYHVPAPPLVLDTWTAGAKFQNYGFEVYRNKAKQTIRSVEADNDCIILTCNPGSDISTGNLEIIYAGIGENTALTRGHGNVRDSDDYPSYFNYIDLDKKENGEYVYYRDPDNSLRPVNEVKGENGQPVYDQPYPLYNWSVAFYYKLDENQNERDVVNSIEASYINNNLSMYASGENLIIHNEEPTSVEINIFDISGRFVSYSRLNVGQTHYSINHLASGAYVVKAIAGRKATQIKLLR